MNSKAYGKNAKEMGFVFTGILMSVSRHLEYVQ